MFEGSAFLKAVNDRKFLWWVIPSFTLMSSVERQRAQLMTALLFPLMILTWLKIAVEVISGKDLSLLYLCIALVVTGFYQFSRSQVYHHAAALGFVFVTGTFSFIAAGIYINHDDVVMTQVILSWTIVLVTLAYLVFSLKELVGFIVFTLLLALLCFLAAPDIRSILGIVILQSLLIVVAAFNRDLNVKRLGAQTQELMTSESQLRKSEQEYRVLLENTPDVIVRFDSQHRYLYVNPAFTRSMGYAEDIFIGKTPRELTQFLNLPPEIITLWETTIQRVFETGKQESLEYSYSVDEEPIFIEARLTPEWSEDGKIRTVLTIVRNITERRQVEEQRLDLARQEEQVQVLQRFTSEAAHDLITPLTTMKTNLYLMKRTTEDPAILRRIELLEDQTIHIENSTNALVKMTRLDHARFQFEPTSINHLIENVVLSYKALAEAKGQSIQLDADIEIPLMMLDSEEFQFVIRELLTNAMAHSSSGDVILMKIAKEKEHALITLIDQGEGIQVKDLPHIFEPFYRSTARESTKGGIGLGLTIAKWIVQAHQGRIEVESMPSRGTTFRIYLPFSFMPGVHSNTPKRITQQFERTNVN